MDVKEAVKKARDYVAEVFSDEEITAVGLEEIAFDHDGNAWKITVGFARPWDQHGTIMSLLGEVRPTRSYKMVRIDNDSGQVEYLKDRLLRD